MRPSAKFPGIPEYRLLKILGHVHADVDKRIDQRIKRAARRAKLVAEIAACAIDGKIAVVEHGCDCDGSAYTGHVTIIDASLAAYEEHWDTTAQWADGPFGFDIARPDVQVERTSRDLAMEAFEDGHRHVIYY